MKIHFHHEDPPSNPARRARVEHLLEDQAGAAVDDVCVIDN
jgi:hypothetical protein